MVLQRWIPDVKTHRKALFCGHFGPMGAGALFLAMEARAQLETGSSIPLPHPPDDLPEVKRRAARMVWPIISFAVLGSTMIHGLSTLAISVGVHFSKSKGERAPLIGAETDRLYGMVHEDEEDVGPESQCN